MHLIDWLIMTLPLLICGAIALYTRRYVRSVADFMAGGRNAGRFLICTARSEQGSGAAVFVASFQWFMVAGFAVGWWGQVSVPVGLLVMVTGFVIYRYRQTRAMSLGQFFEMRYSRGFRLFAGALGFLAGLINFGIIPAVGARFMVAFLQWPQSVRLGFTTHRVDLPALAFLGMRHAMHLFTLGPCHVAVPTFILLMSLFLTICVIMTTTAGQVSVLLTDCAEGMFSQVFYTIIAVALLVMVFKWSDTKAVLLNTKPGESLVNPFDSMGIKDFSFWMVMMSIITSQYRSIAWQNSHAFNSSAATPHESRMGGVLGRWRGFSSGVMVTLLSVCAMTYLRTHTAAIDAKLAEIPDLAARDQMRSPLALTMMLPKGIKGMLLSIGLMGIIAGDGIHLHSWGSIFIQDVVAPLRRKPSRVQTWVAFAIFEFLWLGAAGVFVIAYGAPLSIPAMAQFLGGHALALTLWALGGGLVFLPFGKLISSDRALTPRQHIALLRLSIVGVALWAFLFGALMPQITYVQFWWGITEAIFVSGAGVAIIAGLYWSRGTNVAAWVALLVGSVLAFCGIGAEFFYERVLQRDLNIPMAFWDLHGRTHHFNFHLSVPTICFYDTMIAIACYVGVSYLTGHRRHNMDKLLNRGAYGVQSDVDPVAPGKKRFWLYRIITFGIDEQYSRSDRWITISITLWSMFWFAVFAVGSLVYLFHPWSNDLWAAYWLWTGVYLPLAIGLVTTIWFTWGCTHDMVVFFRRLRVEKVDDHDDGTVNHDDELGGTAAGPKPIAAGTDPRGDAR
jgi:SSS family solute:Na+ symporter